MINKELLEKLRNTEETLLLELLGITSDDIVDAFLDRIEDKLDYLYEQYEEEDTDR